MGDTDLDNTYSDLELTEVTLLALLTSNTFSLVAICSSMFWWKKNKLPAVVRIPEGAIIHYTVQVNLDELCWLVTDDTSFTSPMVTTFTCIPKCFIIVCFAGVSNTALPECKQLIYSDVPSRNMSLFVWTVDILILFQCFSCFHCHLCHCSHQQLEHVQSLPLTLSSLSSSSP